MENKSTEVLTTETVEESVKNAIRAAMYDFDIEIASSDSLMYDLGIDSLEMQVILLQLSKLYDIDINSKSLISTIRNIIDSQNSEQEEYQAMILAEVTKKTGISFSDLDKEDFIRKSSDDKRLMIRSVLEYITVSGITDSILFLKGEKNG